MTFEITFRGRGPEVAYRIAATDKAQAERAAARLAAIEAPGFRRVATVQVPA